MAAWPAGLSLVGGGRMVLYGKHHHPLGLSGGHAGCDVLSYRDNISPYPSNLRGEGWGARTRPVDPSMLGYRMLAVLYTL